MSLEKLCVSGKEVISQSVKLGLLSKEVKQYYLDLRKMMAMYKTYSRARMLLNLKTEQIKGL